MRQRSGGSAGQQRVAAASFGKGEMAAVVRDLPLLAQLRPLGVSVEVVGTGADGLVTLALSAPPKLRPAVEAVSYTHLTLPTILLV